MIFYLVGKKIEHNNLRKYKCETLESIHKFPLFNAFILNKIMGFSLYFNIILVFNKPKIFGEYITNNLNVKFKL